MFGLGTTELIIILVIIVILFGAKKLPEVGKGIGELITNFKKSTADMSAINETPEDESVKTGDTGEKKS